MRPRLTQAIFVGTLTLLVAASHGASRAPAGRTGSPPQSRSATPVASASSPDEPAPGASPTSTPAHAVRPPKPAPAAKPTAGAVNPNAPEVVEPGDIPDNQAFVAFHSPDGRFSVRVPEGWARTVRNGVVTFTDKYNAISIRSMAAAAAPTPASVQSTGLTDVSGDPTYKLVDVSSVTRRAGVGVLARYEIGSAPNKVTGKQALLAVERYVFFHNGTAVELTLSGAKGADNVDPWKTVSDSLAWT